MGFTAWSGLALQPIVEPCSLCDSEHRLTICGLVTAAAFRFGGTVERTPSNNKKPSSQMSWDERLKDARARRAKIMESKHTETIQTGKTLFNPPSDDGDEKLEKLRLAARGELPRQVRRTPVPVKSRRSGLVPLVFGIGILLGVGATQWRVFVPDDPAVVVDGVAMEETAQVAPVVEAVPVPTPVTEPVAEIEPAPVPEPETAVEVAVDLAPPASIGDQTSVLPDVSLDVASLRSGRPESLSDWSAPSRLERPGFVVATEADPVAPGGQPPASAAQAAVALARTVDFEFLETVAAPTSIELTELSSDLEVEPIAVVSRARSVQGLDAYSVSDVVPLSLESATAPILDRSVDDFAALPLVEDTIARSIWIFAPTSVGEDVLASTRSVADRLNFSVEAVNRVAYRISRNQVRFYDADSAEAAARLAEEIGAVPRDFTTSDVNAAPGALEVYLAGRSAGARSQGTTAVRRTTPANDANSLRNSVLGRIRAGLSN